MAETQYIFDFDSTLTRVEALDRLARISLKDRPDAQEVEREIAHITDQGIDGDISFTESLERRLDLLDANRKDLALLVEDLRGMISPSIAENGWFFEAYRDQIYIISCGFKEFIDPIVADLGIPSERVFANTFRFDSSGKIVGFDDTNVLSRHNGKIDCLKALDLEGEVQVIGDGYSDYVMREAGLAHKFFAYTENVHRQKAVDRADHVAPNIEEFLYVNKLPSNTSFPKHRIKILLLENIHEDAENRLKAAGFSVERLAHSPGPEELIERIKGVHVLGIRSKTQVTPEILEAADKLMAVGAFCIGTTQIALEAAKRKGVVVFNAPYSNTRSVVELAMGHIIMLMRRAFDRSQEMHRGEWNKTATASREVRGKRLGIVGYGNIGKQMSILAESFGMQVSYFDIEDRLALGNAVRDPDLETLLSSVDVVTLHVDDNPSNQHLIGADRLALMRPGALLINLSRGFVVDIEALAESLRSGRLGGAAIDVYPEEPRVNGPYANPLQGLSNVILTPHIGGSTLEAQRDIADFVPGKIAQYINSGNTVESVNFPSIRLPGQNQSHRFLHIHENVPGVMARINRILSDFDLNIKAQNLRTDSMVGYVITDVDREYDKDVIEALKAVPHTIRFRVLY